MDKNLKLNYDYNINYFIRTHMINCRQGNKQKWAKGRFDWIKYTFVYSKDKIIKMKSIYPNRNYSNSRDTSDIIMNFFFFKK